MEKRNILFLSTENPYPPDHGHYIRTYNVLKCLSEQYNIFFLGFLKRKEDVKHVDPVRRLCKSTDVFLMPDDISRCRFIISLILNIFSPLPYIAQKYYRKGMKNRIEAIIREQRIDVVHFDMLHLARYRNIVGDIPSVLTEHNVESARIFSLLENSKSIMFKLFLYLQYVKLRNYETRSCEKFNMCITVSEDDMTLLQALNPHAHYVVIPNGVDTQYFKPDHGHENHNGLVWVGGMNSPYNMEAVTYLMHDILPIIKREIPDVKLTVVGKCSSKKILKLAATNGDKLTGYVSDVRSYINCAQVYVAPILSGGGTKLKVLNALSMAKPVVTTPVGAEGIEVEDGKHLLIAKDAKEFAEKTVFLLKHPDYAKELGENGRKLMIEQYDWKVIGSKLLALYEELTKNQKCNIS